ncbi:MAG: hypothetical protein NVS3B19_09380 [Ginsengibacter sp.]
MKSSGIDVEVIVYDNASTDGSEAFFENRFPGVHFIWGKENLGFGKANNNALQKATGKYILFLNPDTIIQEDTLKKCVAYFEAHEKAGGLGVRMLDGAGRFLKESKRGFPNLRSSLFTLSGLSKLFPRSLTFNKYHATHVGEFETRPIDVVAGAFMMIPRKVLDEVGGFDELFFMYGEDIDLSYRIKMAGYENVYLGATSIIHFKGESMQKGSKNYVKHFYEAMEIFVKKHYALMGAVYVWMIVLGIRARAGLEVVFNFLKSFKLYSIRVKKEMLFVVGRNEKIDLWIEERGSLEVRIVEGYRELVNAIGLEGDGVEVMIYGGGGAILSSGDKNVQGKVIEI